MYSQSHFLFSFFIALIFVKFNIFSYEIALLIAVFAVLVDIDHFIKFAVKKRKYNLREAWNATTVKHFKERTFLHHLSGFLIFSVIIISLYFINKNVFLVVGLGYYTHIFLDYANLNVLKIKGKETIKEIGFIERISNFELIFDIFLTIGIILLVL